MKALVACERSGRVRQALRDVGVDAWSCDLEPADDDSPHHIVGDAAEVVCWEWDLLIAHPPCTYLSHIASGCLTGNCQHHHPPSYHQWRWYKALDAVQFFRTFLDASHILKRAIENPQPYGPLCRMMGPHQGVSQPWWFGDPWSKRTWWWLRGLQPLHATHPVEPTHALVHDGYNGKLLPLYPDLPKNRDVRSRLRSETPPGTARAIAVQWGHSSPQTLF